MGRDVGIVLTAVVMWGVAAPIAEACPAPPPAIRDLDIPRFYEDAAGTKVDPLAAARHETATAPLTAFLRHVTQHADKAWTRETDKGRRAAAQCALAWTARWASDGAWLGHMATQQAAYQRKWDLAGVALAYLKLRSHATAQQREAIEPWLMAFADRARAFFDDPRRTRNNHWYWLGLAMAGVAIATDSPRHWDMARGIMADAARDIGADGLLPKEMERGARALHYHVFAAVPLVTMAELAAARGEDWYALGDGALHRLVRATSDAIAAPDGFERAAGLAQERPINTRAAWRDLYAARFPGRLAPAPAPLPHGHRWLGGDVRILFSAAARPRQ